MTTVDDNVNGLELLSGRLVTLFLTYALAMEAVKSLPAGTRIRVTDDPNPDLNGEYTWDGVKLVKTTNNTLEKAEEKAKEIAQDQIKETVTASNILDILSGQITSDILDRRLQQRIDRIPSMTGDIDKIRDQAKEIRIDLENQVKIAEENFEDVLKKIGDLQLEVDVDLQNVLADVQALREQVKIDFDQLKAEVAAIQDSVDADVLALQNKITEIQGSLEDRIAEIEALRADLSQEVTDRLAAIQAETNARVEAIRQLNDGLTKEIQERKDGDTSIFNSLENYKASNDQALANVREEITVAVDTANASAAKVDALDARVTSSEANSTQALENSAEAVTKVNAIATDVGAMSQRVDTLSTQVVKAVDDSGKALTNSATAMTDAKAAVDKSNATAEQVTIVQAKLNNKSTTYRQDTAPTKTSHPDLTVGDIWINTANKNEQKRWSGTAWVDISDVRIGDNATAISKVNTTVAEQGDTIVAQGTRLNSLETNLGNKADASALQSLDAKVTQQGKDIVSNTNSITSLQGAVAGKADASALNELGTKVTDIDGKVTAQATDITNLKSTVAGKADASALNNYYTKAQADSATAGQITAYNSSLTIGANNLIPTQFDLWENGYWNVTTGAAVSATAHIRTKVGVKIPIIGSQKYTIKGGTRIVLIYYTSTDTVAGSYDSGNTTPPTSGVVITAPATATYARAFMFAASGTLAKPTTLNQTIFDSYEIMLVKGEFTKLIWQPSALGTQVQIDANASAYTALDTKVTNIDGKVTTQGTDITALKTSVAGKADTSAVNELKTTVQQQGDTIAAQGQSITSIQNTLPNKADASALNSLSSTVTQQGKDITAQGQSITGITARLDSLQVGGTNLQVNSHFDKENVTNGWSPSSGTLTATGNSQMTFNVTAVASSTRIQKSLTSLVNVGDTYTYTLYASSDLPIEWRTFQNLEIIKVMQPTFVANRFQRHSVTFKVLDGTTDKLIRAYIPNAPINSKIIMEWEKLEIGTTPTDWTPNPADLASADAVSKLDAKVTQQGDTITSQGTAITGLQSTVAGKADATTVNELKTQVTQIDGKVNTQGQAITSLENQIKGKADASALSNLQTTVTQQGDLITSQGKSITSVTATVGAMDSDSLTLDYAMKTPDAWESHYGDDVAPYFVSGLTDGKITTTAYRKDPTKTTYSWMYNKQWLTASRSYKLSMWVRRSTDSSGLCGFTYVFRKPDGTELKGNYVTVSIPTTNVWTLVTAVIPAYDVNTYPMIRFGFAVNHNSRNGIAEVQGFKVVPVLTSDDMDSSVATAATVSSLDAKVTQQGKDITSQGQAITGLQNSIAGKADASAVNELKTTVTQQGTTLTSQGQAITSLQNGLAGKADASALSSLDTKVTQQGETIASQGQSITSLQNGLAGKADTTAVNSLKTTVEQQGSTITAQGQAITGLQSTVAGKADTSALNNYYTKAQADTATAGQISTFNSSLVIGGDNLYYGANPIALVGQTGTGEYKSPADSTGTNQLYKYLDASSLDISSLSVGDDAIASIEVYIPSTNPSDFDMQFSSYRFSSAGYSSKGRFNTSTIPKDKWVRLETPAGKYVGTVQSGINISLFMYARKLGDTFRWRNLMMEKASKASAYSESAKLVDNRITANATAISNTNTTVTQIDGKVNTQAQSITQLNSTVSGLQGQVNNKVDASALNNYYTKTEANTATAGQITEYNASMVVGGENLWSIVNSTLRNAEGSHTIEIKRVEEEEVWITVTGQNTQGSLVAFDNMLVDTNTPIIEGEDVVLSFEYSANQVGMKLGTVYAYVGSANTLIKDMSALPATDPNVWKRAEISFKASAGSGVSGLNQTFGLKLLKSSGWSVGSIISLRHVQLQRGTKSTQYEKARALTTNSVKANATAVQNVDAKVTTLDGKVTSQGTAITGLQNSLAGKADATALNSLKTTVEQQGTTINSQGTAITGLQNNLAGKADASALNSLDTRVTTLDGKVTSQATSITQLDTKVGENTSSIQQQAQSINGIQANWTIKTDVNGYVAGIGLMNGGNTSSFIVRADQIAFAPPASAGSGLAPKYGFVYQASPKTLPNGTVIPAGLYVDNIILGEIDAKKINAESLSAVSGTIGLLRTKATGERVEIRDNLIQIFNANNVAQIELGVLT